MLSRLASRAGVPRALLRPVARPALASSSHQFHAGESSWKSVAWRVCVRGWRLGYRWITGRLAWREMVLSAW